MKHHLWKYAVAILIVVWHCDCNAQNDQKDAEQRDLGKTLGRAWALRLDRHLAAA